MGIFASLPSVTVRAAELTTPKRDDLADQAFAFPEQRKLPLSDAAHVRNALARFNQVSEVSEAQKTAAKARLRAAAKRFGIEVSEDFKEWARFAEPLLVAGPGMPIMRISDLKAGEIVRLPYVKQGEWNFRDSYGPVAVTDDDLDTIVRNFQVGARRQDIPLLVNEEHSELPEGADPKSYHGPGAVGWIRNLEREGDTIYAEVELNRVGEQIYHDDRYRGVSPELLLNWIDPETDQAWGKTAAGLAFTTMPRMKNLAKQGAPLYARERILAFAEAMSAEDAVKPDQTCPTCEGTGKVNGEACPTCNGAGELEADFADDKSDDDEESADFADLASVHVDTALPNLSVALPYAFPEQKRLPLNTAAGVKGALARFMTVEASEPERESAWQRVLDAGHSHGVEVPATWRGLRAAESAQRLLAEADLAQTRATPTIPQSPAIPMKEGAATMTTDATPTPAPVAVEPAPAPAPAPAPEPVKVNAGEKALMAELSETKTLLSAERTQRLELARQLEASETKIAALKDANRKRETADKMVKITDRLDSLVKTGRITPAVRDQYAEHIADFAEDSNSDVLLKGLELLPANTAVDLRERGTGNEPPKGQNEGQRLEIAAHAFMSEKGQKTDTKDKDYLKNYKEALIRVSGTGFQA